MIKVKRNDVKIREFNKNDLVSVVNIAIRAFKPNYASYRKILGVKMFKGFYPDWQEKKKQEIIFLSSSNSCKIFVAEINKKVVGFASFMLNKFNPLIAEISTNAVHPNYQRNGIGKALYSHLLGKLETIDIKYIKVSTLGNESSKPARKAYEKAGFVKSVSKVEYYMEL